MKQMLWLIVAVLSSFVSAESKKNVYFGDTHLHTSYSFDAYLNRNFSADPDTAYRWAKGLPVIHPYNRTRVQIGQPLDFLVVSDHAEMLGVMRAVREETFIKDDLGFFGNLKRWYAFRLMNNAIDENRGREFFSEFLPEISPLSNHPDPVQHPDNNISDLAIFGDTSKTSKVAWDDIVDSTERHNEPGVFTAMLGWEWSSIPMGANLHRIVITPDGPEKTKRFLPYGSDQSQYPEDLWAWLGNTEKVIGARFLAIPHNSNLSKGYMFDNTTLKGKPITADYARRRMLWEPVVEVTQFKGDSETHSALSADDQFADFENYEYYIQKGKTAFSASVADFIRPALKRGLSVESKIGVNPYKFGLIGSTDAHTGLSSAEEDNFWGKFPTDSIPENKTGLGIGQDAASGWDMSASGLAAVWAEENTRESIFAAFKRKEVYATTGPRIRLQMFAGWDFPVNVERSEDLGVIGRQYGVPMGGDLTSIKDQTQPPQFILRAVKDPAGANLERLQIVKGWLDNKGEQREKVFNVAWSDNRELSPDGSLARIKSTVDLRSARYTNSVGETEFSVRWVDPDFNPEQSAFYYARVLQIPTPRNGLLDSLALQLDTPPKGPNIIQERAYSSPIWYQP